MWVRPRPCASRGCLCQPGAVCARQGCLCPPGVCARLGCLCPPGPVCAHQGCLQPTRGVCDANGVSPCLPGCLCPPGVSVPARACSCPPGCLCPPGVSVPACGVSVPARALPCARRASVPAGGVCAHTRGDCRSSSGLALPLPHLRTLGGSRARRQVPETQKAVNPGVLCGLLLQTSVSAP